MARGSIFKISELERNGPARFHPQISKRCSGVLALPDDRRRRGFPRRRVDSDGRSGLEKNSSRTVGRTITTSVRSAPLQIASGTRGTRRPRKSIRCRLCSARTYTRRRPYKAKDLDSNWSDGRQVTSEHASWECATPQFRRIPLTVSCSCSRWIAMAVDWKKSLIRFDAGSPKRRSGQLA